MSQDTKKLLYKAAKRILKPLVRLLLRHEVSHSDLAELTRQVFVEVAYEDFAIPGRKTTYSRIAVLTGLSRKEVVRLVKLQEAGELVQKVRPNRAMRVVNGWLNDPEFLRKDNTPKVLPLNGDKSSFRVLVERYSGDITIGAVLDELGRLGVISLPDEETVELKEQGYIPVYDAIEKLDILAMCASDLLTSGTYNLLHEDQPPRFQRQVTYHDLSAKTANDFQAYSNKKSNLLLNDYNRYLNRKKKSRLDSGSEEFRIGVGIYYFEESNVTEERRNENREKEKQ